MNSSVSLAGLGISRTYFPVRILGAKTSIKLLSQFFFEQALQVASVTGFKGAYRELLQALVPAGPSIAGLQGGDSRTHCTPRAINNEPHVLSEPVVPD